LAGLFGFSGMILPNLSPPLPNLSDEELVELVAQRSPRDKRKILKSIIDSLVPEKFGPFFMPPTIPPQEVPAYKAWELEYMANVQSMGFIVEMMPHIHKLLREFPIGVYTCLDVGTRTGSGANLFGQLFGSLCSYIQIKVDTIDKDPTFADYQMARYKDVRHIMVGDVFQVPDQSYDFVICSHTLEHIDDPIPFAQKLTKIAKRYAFFYMPYNEQDPLLLDHRRIDDKLVDALNPINKAVIDSWHWRKGEEQTPQQCVFFATKGGAV
jgi:hypothetical protein